MTRRSWDLSRFLAFSCLFLPSLISVAKCFPHVDVTHSAKVSNNSLDTFSILDGESHLHKKDEKPFELRILPLGASITYGLLSESENGYRKPLRDQLRYDGWEVDMVGTKSHGSMKDNECEAHSGDIIDAVKEAAKKSLPYRPNVVLINAGTNDCRLETDIPHTGERMRSLINTILDADGMNKTTIVLSTLIPSNETNTKKHRDNVNNQYRDLVKSMRGDGVNIVLADMDPPEPADASGWIVWPDDFNHDGEVDDTHPNDHGYAKMARIWFNAINDAQDQKLIEGPGVMTSTTCDKEYGDGVYAGGLTQQGSGEDDGIYYHSSESKGVIFEIESKYASLVFVFARLLRSDRDDLILWQKIDEKVQYTMWRNSGTDTDRFQQLETLLSVNDNCNPKGIRFIDINADGLDDFICIAKDGTTYASVNQGDGDSSRPPTFKSIGKWKDAVPGYDQSHVVIGDVDGDGRGDYCVIEDNGDLQCWRNGWIDDVPKYWQPLGKRFTGKGMGDIGGVRLLDVNGDGRDDWLWVDNDGATYTWTNSRSCIKGKEGDGLNIVWRQGFQVGHSSGPTHSGMTGFDKGKVSRNAISFPRIYGTKQDFGLHSHRDYVFLEVSEAGKGKYSHKFHAFKNTGSGATKIKSDGNRYCNMMGHDNGMMDYVWILSKGSMHIYPNKGLGSVPNDGSSFWGPNKDIFDPHTTGPKKDLNRRDLHLVDWDGDGTCDIVWTDPDNDNRVSLWLNRIKDTGDFNWEYHANPAPDLYCPEKRGIGQFDNPVHMADVSGSARADYLCVEKDGRSWGWTQSKTGSFEYIDQFKFSEGKDRANLHWADVDGDGKADMIHTDKFNGDGSVWYNKGRKDIGGSRYWWDPVGKKFQGAVEGSCTYFPDLDGNGRADMHSIIHSIDNTAKTWFSLCGRTDKTGDDGPIEDPELPVIPEGGNVGNPKLTWGAKGTAAECSSSQKPEILKEFRHAIQMAQVAEQNTQKWGFYDTFFSSGVRATDKFAEHASNVYKTVGDLLDGSSIFQYVITCDSSLPGCQGDKPELASMNGGLKRLNICPRFFNDQEMTATLDKYLTVPASIREAHHVRSAVILHEMTHTKYAMRLMPDELAVKAHDYAYGWEACKELAEGTFNRGCQPWAMLKGALCKVKDSDPAEDGLCEARFSAANADTWAVIAAGIFFSEHWNRQIPLTPSTGASTKRTSAKRDVCVKHDALMFDHGSGYEISDIVAFGDSFAAGMGTDPTTTDCRIGGQNYPSLLQQHYKDSGNSLDIEKKMCSGDTTSGLKGQIENWKSSDRANLGTLTMGGNDLGFSDIVWNCVITPATWHLGSTYRQWCVEAEDKARELMNDQGENGLRSKLSTLYSSILQKAAQPDFQLFVAGYPGFFNQDTSDCDDSTFHYLWAAYKPPSDWPLKRLVYLDKSLRSELNNLVNQLNNLIQDAVKDTNTVAGRIAVHYVDVQSRFDSHRWCEQGIHEPDAKAPNTYFFLSAWNDIPLADSASASSDVEDISTLQQNGIKLPDADTCKQTQGENPDPYQNFLCLASKAIGAEPNGPMAWSYGNVTQALKDGDFSSQEVSRWYPTRQIKTFHPRSPGMALYRDAVVEQIEAVIAQ